MRVPDAAVRQPSLAETAVQPARAVGGLLLEDGPHDEDGREQMVAALTDPTWLTYLGVLVGAMVVTLVLGILLLVK